MFMDFLPSQFFDLSAFEHAAIFDQNQPVWKVLSKIKSYLQAQTLGKHEGVVQEGAFLANANEITIGKGSIIEPGAYVMGPCIIGENCQIRHGAYIRGCAIIGNKCVVGHATEVKNSIFLNGAQAGHFAYIGDSILGNQVNLGAGTKCANLRFDRKNIAIHHDGRKIECDLKKMGLICADGAQTGCNSVTNPGTIMGKSSCLGPCATASGFIPSFQLVKSSG